MIPRIEIYLPTRNSIAKFDKPIYVWYSMVYNIYICNIYLKNIVNICHLYPARIDITRIFYLIQLYLIFIS